MKHNLKVIYYLLKPVIPQFFRILLRRIRANQIRKKSRHIWPIDYQSSQQPKDWQGWPDKKQFCLLLTHDVEKMRGYQKVPLLAELNHKMGFKSCFNFVPHRYKNRLSDLVTLQNNGFEIGVHGLTHDGKLFSTYEIFKKRRPLINQYLKDWNSVGFYAPATLRNLDWIHQLNIEYDSSTFDTDPFEPQPDGYRTIFPFSVENHSSKDQYIEIPYTLPQDFSLFIILNEKDNQIWKTKIDWIVKNGGLVHLRTHPDYMNFENRQKLDEYPVQYYEDILYYIKEKYQDQYWNPLPKELSQFWNSFENKNKKVLKIKEKL